MGLYRGAFPAGRHVADAAGQRLVFGGEYVPFERQPPASNLHAYVSQSATSTGGLAMQALVWPNPPLSEPPGYPPLGLPLPPYPASPTDRARRLVKSGRQFKTHLYVRCSIALYIIAGRNGMQSVIDHSVRVPTRASLFRVIIRAREPRRPLAIFGGGFWILFWSMFHRQAASCFCLFPACIFLEETNESPRSKTSNAAHHRAGFW